MRAPPSLRIATLAALLCLLHARAGSYSNDFTYANGTTALGGGTTVTAGGTSSADGFPVGSVVNNRLRLADKAMGSQTTGFIIPDLDAGAPIASFTVRFDLNFNRIGTDTPADGFSFSCGKGLAGGTSETGYPVAGGMVVGWDTYSNGATDPIAMDFFSDGAQYFSVTAQSLFGGNAPYFPYDTTFRTVEIHWDEGGLDVTYLNNVTNALDDLVIAQNLEIPGFAPVGGESFGFGARTGGAKQDVFLDNLSITTTRSTVVPTPETGGPVISEFMADNAGTLEDEDRDTPDWIEIYNGQNVATNLAGWTLSLATNGVPAGSWIFPSLPLAPYGYALVFASGKNRTTFQNVHPHTSFTLPKSGGTLRLLNPALNETSVLTHTNQAEDVSFGHVDFAEPAGYLETPTPLARNRGRIAAGPPLPDPLFSIPSQVRVAATNLVISLPTNAPPGCVIRHTLFGNTPSETSPLVTGPLAITATTQVKARLFHPDHLPSRVGNRSFVFLASDLASNYNSSGQPFRSNLPVLVLESFSRNVDNLTNPAGLRPYRYTQAAIFDLDAATGLATLGTSPSNLCRAATHVRGQSSSGLGQRPYALEFWREHADEDRDVSILGFPDESDFVLHSPGLDKTLIRNHLAYTTLLETDGQGAAMRSRFVEVFFNQDGGSMAYADYRGVYLLVERIKRTGDRLNLEKINSAMADPALISGGYIFKIDKTPYQAPITTAGNGSPWGARTWDVEDPEPASTAQLDWLRTYLNNTDKALMSATFATPASTNYYGNWLDSASFIDRFWFQELHKEVDGFVFSHYMSKDRGQPMRARPMWDLDRSLGNANYGHADTAAGFLTWRGAVPHYPRLQADPEYVTRQWDRWWELRRGIWSTAALEQRIESFVAQLTANGNAALVTGASAPALQNPASRHFKRWGTLGTNSHGSGIPAQVDFNTYRKEVDAAKTWLFARLEWIDGYAPMRPALAVNPANQMERPSGNLPLGAALGVRNLADTSPVYLTLDGPDPRAFGGGVDPAAVIAAGTGGTTVSTLVAGGGSWKYLAPASAPAADWNSALFDDSGWTAGNAPMGYGETGMATTLAQPAQTNTDAPPPVYFRRTFTVADPAAFSNLWAEVRADDGAVIHLNGQEAGRIGMPVNVPVGFGTRFPTAAGGVYGVASGPHDAGLYETTYNTVVLSRSLLVPGTNVLAVSVHQAFYGNTSATDMQFDCRLKASAPTAASAALTLDTPGVHTLRLRPKNGSVWGPLTTYSYVVDAVPAAATNLVVSEIHYHPLNPTPAEQGLGFLEDKEFEFLELLNVGSVGIDLNGVVITNAVSFAFDDGDPAARHLAPGERVVVVENPAAFALRAPTNPPPRVAGTYAGSLGNAGETIEVRAAGGALITSVTYGDQPAWPTTPDGLGPSLVYNHPFARPDPNLPSSWRPSAWDHGRAGGADADPLPPDPLGDSDNDGVANLLEHALPPGHQVAALLAPHSPAPGVTNDFLVVSIRRNLAADGFTLVPERSANLTTWDGDAFEYLSILPHGDGTATLNWRSTAPAGPGTDYVRVRVQP